MTTYDVLSLRRTVGKPRHVNSAELFLGHLLQYSVKVLVELSREDAAHVFIGVNVGRDAIRLQPLAEASRLQREVDNTLQRKALHGVVCLHRAMAQHLKVTFT